MNYSFSYDIQDQGSGTDDRRRINLAFERCGWESFGDTHWVYPPLEHADAVNDDFFNNVLPALYYFRTLVSAKELKVSKFCLAVNSDSIFSADSNIGHPILPASQLSLDLVTPSPSQAKLSAERLRRVFKEAEESIK
jgi:hypothetical protein